MNMRRSRRTRTESPTEVVASNDDLMIKIMLLLPVKILIRLKMVCKHWHALITDRNFFRRHNTGIEHRHRIIPSGLFLYHFVTNRYEFLSLPNDDLSLSHIKSLGPPAFPSDIKILHSCNGLLCYSTDNPIEFTSKFFIFNPTTQQSAPLPRSCKKGTKFSSSIICGMTLAYDPAISPCYKVVSIQSPSINSNQYWVEIYSSETCCWQVVSQSFTPTGTPRFVRGVYWNMAVHWVSHYGDSLYFDITREQILIMPMPPNPTEIRSICYFGESEGHMYLVDRYESETLTLDVYELERNYSGWFVRYRVDLISIASVIPLKIINELFDSYCIDILSLVRGEMEEGSFLVLHILGLIIRYQFTEKNCRVICNSDDLGTLCEWFNVHPYFESFACV